MIRKGRPLPLEKPSTMRTVLSAIESGSRTLKDVVKATGLRYGRVRSAIHNLSRTGVISCKRDKLGRHVYHLPGEWTEPINDDLKGVSFIFDVKIIRTDLPCFTTSDNKSNEHP